MNQVEVALGVGAVLVAASTWGTPTRVYALVLVGSWIASEVLGHWLGDAAVHANETLNALLGTWLAAVALRQRQTHWRAPAALSLLLWGQNYLHMALAAKIASTPAVTVSAQWELYDAKLAVWVGLCALYAGQLLVVLIGGRGAALIGLVDKLFRNTRAGSGRLGVVARSAQAHRDAR